MSEREALWGRLREAALVQGEVPPPGEDRSPWFVRVMLGVAGWLGAMFLLGFFGIAMASLLNSAAACIAVGAALCAGVAFLLRTARGDFAAQFGFALSLAGQALLAFGIARALGGHRFGAGAAFAVALQQAVLFVAVPAFTHRVWCAFSASYAAAHAFGNLGLHAFVPPAITAAFLLVWLRELDHARFASLRRAAGYGLALALALSVIYRAPWYLLLAGLYPRPLAFDWLFWAGAAASGAVLVAAIALLLRREGVPLASGPGRLALAAALIVAVASLKAPGLGPVLSILVIGFANGNRVLAGVGVIALLGYLSHYYYSMQTTLLEKSALLAATGAALLLARLALHRWWPLQPEGARA